MKSKKLMSMAMAIAMLATSVVGAMSAKAEDVLKGKGTVTKGYDLVYNETLSSEKVRYIDIYAVGASKVDSMSLTVVIDAKVENGNKSDPLEAWQAGSMVAAPQTSSIMVSTSKAQYSLIAYGDDTYWTGDLVGRLRIEVASADTEFVASVNATKSSFSSGASKTAADAETLNVPKFATAPVEPDEPDEPKLPAFDDELTATAIEDLFDDDTTTVPVKAWMTDAVDWSSYDAVKALNWIITVNGVEQEPVAATSETEITGGMTVIYGLAIAGQADQLATIDSVVLK